MRGPGSCCRRLFIPATNRRRLKSSCLEKIKYIANSTSPSMEGEGQASGKVGFNTSGRGEGGRVKPPRKVTRTKIVKRQTLIAV